MQKARYLGVLTHHEESQTGSMHGTWRLCSHRSVTIPEQLPWHPESRSRTDCIWISQVKERFMPEMLGLFHPLGQAPQTQWTRHVGPPCFGWKSVPFGLKQTKGVEALKVI